MRARRWAVVTRDTAGNVLGVWPCWTRSGARRWAARHPGNLVTRAAERRPEDFSR